MEILSLEDLNLSTNARNFVDDHIKRLNKPLKIVHFPDDYPQYASTFNNPDFYVIGMRTNFLKKDFDATLCHELFHAYQLSAGFPIVAGHAPDTQEYCERLRSTILDLGANEAVKAYGLTYDTIISTRYADCKRLCATSFKTIKTPFAKDLLTIDLILDLSDFSLARQDKILSRLKLNLPDVYNSYNEFHHMIFETFDYHTPEGCLNIFGYVFNKIGLWKACEIIYRGKTIKSFKHFNEVRSSIGAM